MTIKDKINFINKDIMLLDSRIKYENDKVDFNSMNKDIMPTGCSGQCPSMTEGNNISLSPLDNDPSSLSPSGDVSSLLSSSDRAPPHSVTLRQ